jgi:hypothetical protein
MLGEMGWSENSGNFSGAPDQALRVSSFFCAETSLRVLAEFCSNFALQMRSSACTNEYLNGTRTAIHTPFEVL